MSGTTSSRKRLILISGFLVAFLAVLNISTFALYRRAKSYLDTELGERLRSIAITLAHAVENAQPDGLENAAIAPSLYTMLHMVRTENLLSNIVILTPDGRTVVDLGNFSDVGEMNPFIELDFTAVTLARSGLSASTTSYKSGDIYMKSAYAPVLSADNEVIGILGVEAGANYFDVLRELGNAIIFVVITSLIIIVVLGLFFYRQSVSLDRAQAAVIRGENLATMGRMVAGIAHEIRNPLSIIKTSAERLQNKHGSDDEMVSYISEEVDKLDHILTGYLNFARAESQESQPQCMQKIIRRCLLILESEIQAKSVEIITRLPEGDVMVMGDDKRIQQAILNVVINAVQAVDVGGRIEIAMDMRSKSATILIKDDGAGISAKQLKEVTKPFYTTKKRGSGLGMSIVSNIVEEHNGGMDIRSEPGAGTEIAISLPIAQKE
jgi:signal transduction histidine kinase